MKEIIDSGKYRDLKSVNAQFLCPNGIFPADDIRFNYDLGGGSCMNMTYVLSACRFYTGDTVTVRVEKAVPRFAKDEKIDEAMVCDFVSEREGKPDVQCRTRADSVTPPFLGFIPRWWEAVPHFVLELEKARIEYFGFVLPVFAKGIVIHEEDENGRVKKVADGDFIAGAERYYADVDVKKWWTTYRFQLESFVGKIRAAEAGKGWKGPWMSMDQSVAHAGVIDAVYQEAGMLLRRA